jgi:hypothetical protein
VSAQTTYTWRRQDRIDRGLEPGTSSSEHAALTRLRTSASTSSRPNLRSLAGRWICSRSRPTQKAVRGHRGDGRGRAAGAVQVACRTLQVSESGYYAALHAAPSERAIRHAWLTDVIRQVHADSRQTYGSRRVHAELTLGRGLIVGYEQVTLLMRRAGIHSSACPQRWAIVKKWRKPSRSIRGSSSRCSPRSFTRTSGCGGRRASPTTATGGRLSQGCGNRDTRLTARNSNRCRTPGSRGNAGRTGRLAASLGTPRRARRALARARAHDATVGQSNLGPLSGRGRLRIAPFRRTFGHCRPADVTGIASYGRWRTCRESARCFPSDNNEGRRS